VDKHDLWTLVMATTRVRLTAASLAGLCAYCPAIGPPAPDGHSSQLGALRHLAADLAGFYQRIAAQLGPPRRGEAAPGTMPVPPGGSAGTSGPGGAPGPDGAADGAADGPAAGTGYQPHAVWVGEQLQDLASHAHAITAPAEHVAQLRRVPWWR
jgi:hypothetical protein